MIRITHSNASTRHKQVQFNYDLLWSISRASNWQFIIQIKAYFTWGSESSRPSKDSSRFSRRNIHNCGLQITQIPGTSVVWAERSLPRNRMIQIRIRLETSSKLAAELLLTDWDWVGLVCWVGLSLLSWVGLKWSGSDPCLIIDKGQVRSTLQQPDWDPGWILDLPANAFSLGAEGDPTVLVVVVSGAGWWRRRCRWMMSKSVLTS